MNLQLVPKYKKFNKTLSQVFFVSVPASFRESPGSYAHELPVPIKIDPYKQKKRRGQVRLGQATVFSGQARQSKISKLLLIKKNRKDSFSESEKGCCGFSRWYAQKKALRELEAEKKRREKQAEEWSKWKYREADRFQRAEREKAQLEREAEYLRQVQEIEDQRRKLVKNALKTRFPYPTVKRPPPKESFKKNLSTEPYFPKRTQYENDEFNIAKSKKDQKREKREIKKIEKAEKKRKKSNLVPFEDKPPDCKCSKFKLYINKIKDKGKNKRTTPYIDYQSNYDKPRNKKDKVATPYTDPYKDLYNKPYENKKQKEEETKLYTDVYQANYDKVYEKPLKTYDEPTTSKRKSQDDADLYARYYDLYGTDTKKEKKQKKTKTKQQKITKTDLEKRKSCDFSQKFVNCFYRTCCECYCWFSIFLIIGIALIMVV